MSKLIYCTPPNKESSDSSSTSTSTIVMDSPKSNKLKNSSPPKREIADSEKIFKYYDGHCLRDSSLILEQIDLESKKANKWSCELPFDCKVYGDDMKAYDILHLTTSYFKTCDPILYFPKEKYNPDEGFSGRAWLDLKRDLELGAIQNGFNIMVSSGSDHRHKSDQRVFRCKHGVTYWQDSSPLKSRH